MIKKIFALAVFLAIVASGAFIFWAQQPIADAGQPAVEFTVQVGSSVRGSAQQIADAGVAVNPTLFSWLVRLTGKASKLKAGTYSLKPGATPLSLIRMLEHGEFAQESIIIIEGWTFAQMRHAIDTHPALKHESAQWSDRELLIKVMAEKTPQDYISAEGLFFPDTYLFAPGASDLQVYKQAYQQMLKHLSDDWARHDPDLPIKSPYEALILASIVEKETGQKSERGMVAGVFVNPPPPPCAAACCCRPTRP